MYSNRIFFERPNIPELLKTGYTVVDMHCHSKYSDGWNRVSTIIKQAKKLGIGIALSDHNVIKGHEILGKSDVLSIPAMEVTIKEGIHILTYFHEYDHLKDFYTKYVEKNKAKDPNMPIDFDSHELLDKAKEYDGVISAAHPFIRKTRQGLVWEIKKKRVDPELIRHINALEIINGMEHPSANQNAFGFLNQSARHLGFTAGSDAHVIKNLGLAVTLFESSTVEGVLNDIKKKKNFLVGSEGGIVKKGKSAISILYRHHLVYPGAFVKAKIKRRKEFKEFKKNNGLK